VHSTCYLLIWQFWARVSEPLDEFGDASFVADLTHMQSLPFIFDACQ
jgi:hypothetical protein